MTTPTTEPRVGGETDAFCTKCELLLAHTILAMVGPKIARVRCETCKTEHAYRGAVVPKGAKKPGKPKKARVSKEEKIVIGWEEALKGHDLTKAKKYNPRESYPVDTVVDHPTFGLGVVMVARNDKVEVSFKAFTKVLLHQRADGQASRPTFSTTQPKNRPSGETSDSPPAVEGQPSTPDGGSGSVAP